MSCTYVRENLIPDNHVRNLRSNLNGLSGKLQKDVILLICHFETTGLEPDIIPRVTKYQTGRQHFVFLILLIKISGLENFCRVM